MKSSIVPLSQVDPGLVYGFFERRGVPGAHIAWKYFDHAFNAGRERALVWHKDGQVKGFNGMIPVTLATPGGDREMVWTCDWLVDDHGSNPGVGIKLLRKIQDSHDYTCGVGGSEDTHAILPRMNTCTVADTAVFLHRPLRLRPLLEKAEERLGFLPKLSRSSLGKVRLAGGGAGSVRFAEGVIPALAPLFDRRAEGHCRVRYDLRHLEWLARCPGVRMLSAISGDQNSPDAAALLWARHGDPSYWRAVFRSVPGRAQALEQLVRGVSGRIVNEGGALITTIVSHLDDEPLRVLKGNRFLEGSQRWPMYIPRKDEPGSCQDGFADMSYFDTDLAMTF